MKRYRNARAPALLAALCLALAGCGEALGSEPVVVSDNSPSYVDGVSSAPGKDFAALAGAATTEAGTVYLDVTDEMYATGRYGEKPDGAGCISAAQAADLAAQYAASFVDYGAENNVWTLHLETGTAVDSEQPLWSCLLPLPKWSEDAQAVLNDPILQALTQEELLYLGDVCRLRFYINAVTGQVFSGECDLPCDLLATLTFLPDFDKESLQAYSNKAAAWLDSEDAAKAARQGFSAIVGADAEQIERYTGNALFCDFILSTASGEQYALMLRHETGLLKRFYLLTEDHRTAAEITKGDAS